MKVKIVVGLVIAIGCAVACVVVVRRQATWQTVKAERKSDSVQSSNQTFRATVTVEAPSTPEQSTPEQVTAPYANTSQTQSERAGSQNNVRKQAGTMTPQVNQNPDVGSASIPEPLARAALSFVGTDRDAEKVWILAINDPTLSPDARKNLIEDLNEDGFPDPKNPTARDLPLIASRIALIEQLAPDAMDEVNTAAFQEAYKDLANTYNRLTGS